MTKEVRVTRIYERNYDAQKPIVVNVGGARSSKSYSILQLLVQKFVSEPRKNILIARKTLPSLRLTAYKVFVELLKEYGYYDDCEHNKTERTIHYSVDPNDPSCRTTVNFLSIDDPDKIKSTEFNYAFLEEANEFTFNDFFIVWTRMSGHTDDNPNKVYLALNPNDEFSWVNTRLPEWDDAEFIHSTFNDNPFLSDQYRKILTDLKDTDMALYKIYALGQWAQLPNIIYRNHTIDENVGLSSDEWYGIDFGYTVPTALIRVSRRGGVMFIEEKVYQTHLTNQDLIQRMGELNISTRAPIYADSAEPGRIEEIYRAGYNIIPAAVSYTHLTLPTILRV